MCDIDLLHKMIRDTGQIPVKATCRRKKVELTESQCPGSSVTINGLPDKVIVIKADAFKSPDKMFKSAQGQCKRADYIIVADTGNKKVIICIEMKAAQNSRTEIVQQLIGAECLALYCQAIGKKFWKEKDFLVKFKYRFICFSHTDKAKKRKPRTTRSSGVHDRPDKMLKIDWPHYLEFDHLAGK